MKKLYQDENWLYQKYVVEELSTITIGELCGTSWVTIGNWLRRFKIPMRLGGQVRKGKTYEEIYGVEKGKTLRQKRKEQIQGKRNPMYGVHLFGEQNPNYGKRGKDSPRYGIPLSEKTRKKIGDGLKKFTELHPGIYSDEKHPRWKGGCVAYFGRIARKVWEDYWREVVPKKYVVHHINEDITNNYISNLVCMPTGKHTSLHAKRRNSIGL